MKSKTHIKTKFLHFIFEKYKDELNDELNDEETNLPDEEMIDEIENDEVLKDKDDELNLEELIEEYNKLTNKYKKIKNDNSYYRRK
jgi:hypothetical protein